MHNETKTFGKHDPQLNAVKFYFEQVLHREKLFLKEIPRPQKKSSLPKVFSKGDIVRFFAQVENLKHVLMLKLCYGMGLRVSEIVNLINDEKYFF